MSREHLPICSPKVLAMDQFHATESNERCSISIPFQVMLTKNINVHRNLVNGARGVVKGFDTIKGKGQAVFMLEVVFSGGLRPVS